MGSMYGLPPDTLVLIRVDLIHAILEHTRRRMKGPVDYRYCTVDHARQLPLAYLPGE